MDWKLPLQDCINCIKFFAGAVLVALLLFLPAGTLAYRNGWLFMSLLFIPMFFVGLVLWLKAPALLRKRLDMKEKQAAQKTVIRISGVMFLAGFILAGLDHRFGWTNVPRGVVAVFSVLFLLSYLLYAEVLRENAYLSRTITVQKGQKLMDTGLYGIVRHPMYSASILLFLSMPLILGSWISFAVFLIYPYLMVLRIRNEETVLRAELLGYIDYCSRVKYRLLLFLW